MAVTSIAGVALAASPAAASEPSLAVYPIVECVAPTSTGFTAVFGYNNQTGATQTLPIGTLNNFLPTPQNRGQPTTFGSGRHDNVFSASWTSSSSYLYWALNNQNGAVANSSSPKCSTPSVPFWGPQTLLWAAAAAAALVAWYRLHARAAPHPV